MKNAIILVTMMTICLASGAALAKKPASAPVGPDWDAAYEFGVLMNTDIDENGVVWETYHDSAQKLTWTQTAGATKDDALASIAAGSVPIDEEGFVAEGALSGEALGGGAQPMAFCVFVWPTPLIMQIYDGISSNVELDDWDTKSWSSTATQIRFYWGVSGGNYLLNSQGAVSTVTRSAGSSLCNATYFDRAQYSNWDGGNGGATWVDDDWTEDNGGDPYCSSNGTYTWFYVYEDDDIAGETQWDYNVEKAVTRYMFYACDYTRYHEMWVYPYDIE